MKKLIHIIIALFCTITLHAQEKNLKFAYDIDFEMNFDNREFYKSAFSSSMTIFGARLTPAIGLEAVQKDAHRIASWQASMS